MGTEIEFEADKNFNFEGNISMNIELKKTCYSKGEIIQGNLYICPKHTPAPRKILNPYAEITLREHHYYEYNKSEYNSRKQQSEVIKMQEEENVILVNENLRFSNNNELNIANGYIIPFEIKIPILAYPSCIFDSTSYVKHYLSINFPSIYAKKTVVIIIKNNIFYNDINGFLKSPVVINREITKHKYIFFNYGSFRISIVLPKNIFSYDETIPFLIDIDCSKLDIKVRGIKVFLYREIKKNMKNDHQVARKRDKRELIRKYIALTDGEKNLHIEDNIKLPTSPQEVNPKVIYSILDNDQRSHKEKYKNIRLYPACYDGLLTCQYSIQFEFDLDSWFTTNEDFSIPLDFGELFNEFTPTPKKPIFNAYISDTTNQNNNTNDDELPDENEIYKNSNSNDNGFTKPGDDDNTKDGDAPPPSFG